MDELSAARVVFAQQQRADGNTAALHLLHPAVPVLDRAAFSGLDAAGVCALATIIRKLLVFLHVKELMFAHIQNYFLSDGNARERRCQSATDLFFAAVASLTSKCEDDCRKMITLSKPENRTWRHRGEEGGEQLTQYVIRHYHGKTESLEELAEIAVAFGMPLWRLRTWIQKRWRRLDAFLANEAEPPAWLPKGVPQGDVIEALQTGLPIVNV